jgi:RNA 3'-terminal phosphate cyclase (ATP)
MQTIDIDGSIGEGGGQVLRTALALSICTGKPFRIHQIRATRPKPGLQRQHLTAVQAARDISAAQVEGDKIGSKTLHFIPNGIWPGNYHFAIGTAGSTTLVLQTVLYPLLQATEESRLTLIGGTHNPYAPPYDFLAQSLLPLLTRMGLAVTLSLQRHGFYPAGGGQLTVHISPTGQLNGLRLIKRSESVACQAKALITGIPEHVAYRELERVAKKLKWSEDCLHFCPLPSDQGPGNVLLLMVTSDSVTEVFTGFAKRGVRAETVADGAIKQVNEYLAARVPIGEYLADQLLLPLALAGEGEFVTQKPSLHTLTNIDVIQKFLTVPIETRQQSEKTWLIRVGMV